MAQTESSDLYPDLKLLSNDITEKIQLLISKLKKAILFALNEYQFLCIFINSMEEQDLYIRVNKVYMTLLIQISQISLQT